MKIFKSYLDLKDESILSVMEITDRSLTKSNGQYSLNRNSFRYSLPLESQSHRNYGKINYSSFAVPKRCQIAGEQYSEQAFSILQYQLKDEQTRTIHFNNLKRNLERRIQSAKAQGNLELVDLLTQEFRQLALSSKL